MRKLAELITNTLPGEIIVCCYKEDYPICSINDKLLEKLGYTEEELTEETISEDFEETEEIAEETETEAEYHTAVML